MRQKILYFLITLFGTATLVSGYLWSKDYKQRTTEIKKIIETNITDGSEPRSTNNDQWKTNYILPNVQKTPSPKTQVLPPETPPSAQTNPEETFEAKVRLEINGTELIIPYRDGMTTEHAMEDAHTKYPESFWYESIEYGGDLGTFVKSVNGISENPKKRMYWILYINGKKSNKGISTLKLNPDDLIMWNYEKEIL